MKKKLGERLVEAGLVTSASIDKALEHQQITGHRLGDCLVELGLLQEAALLRFLAAEFQTRFVSAEKLARAKVQTEVLDKLPVRLAEEHNILPLAYDPERNLLSVVAAEPQNKQVLEEIARVAGISEVYAYVSLRSAIAAAIKKHYYGDLTAFSNPEPSAPSALRADVSAMATAYESTSGTLPRAPLRPSLRMETDPRLRQGSQSRSPSSTGRATLSGLARGAGLDGDYLETLNILVTLLEKERKHHQGHSAHLARQASEIARRMGMPPWDVASVAIAAYLHDLGKPASRHFCLASNAVNPEWKAEAKRYCRMPTRLFEAVHLPLQVNTMLAQLYEAYDGSGTPQGVKGEEITLGARILSAVDSYLELTRNPANAYGRTMTRDQALAHLRENAGLLYDPMVADIVKQVQSGAFLRQRIMMDGRQVLIVDPEEGTRTDLLESAQRQGLVAHALSMMEGAYDALANQECDVLAVGLTFRLPEVLLLLRATRTAAESAGLPVVVLGEPDEATREQLMMGGATAVVSPADPDEAARVIRALYDDRILHNGPARVVCGSLDEVPTPELLKVLGKAKKSGRLHLKHHAHEGFLHLEQGRAVFASFGGQLGAQAMQLLLGLSQADFRYEPDSLLLDVPQLDMDLEVLAQKATPRKAAASSRP
jgi:HD-GYP domain-containing protein (c-di-GMP phosphodiesterase class II)/DNA-binding response OmpR family regulator